MADYCGCCGREIEKASGSSIWCRDCAGHVKNANLPLAERTYFAQHDQDCPFQVSYVVPPPSGLDRHDGLKDLLDEALDIMSHEPGLSLETHQRMAHWWKACEKAFREFGQ